MTSSNINKEKLIAMLEEFDGDEVYIQTHDDCVDLIVMDTESNDKNGFVSFSEKEVYGDIL